MTPETINTIVIVDVPLTPAARVETYAVAIEAKCAASVDHGSRRTRREAHAPRPMDPIPVAPASVLLLGAGSVFAIYLVPILRDGARLLL